MDEPPDEPSLLVSVRALGLGQIGRSTAGRPIWGGVLPGTPPGMKVGTQGHIAPLLVVGGIHGDEPSSVEAVVALVARLRAGLLAEPLVVVPALNPDGVARGAKNSARDVDLNRNFGARNWKAEHAPGYFPGTAPLSEPETRLFAELVDAHAVRGVVAVHAPFACVNYDGPARAWAEAVAAACGWPARGDIGYPTPGSLGSWLGVDRGVPVLTLELPAGPHAAFGQQAAAALDAAVRPGALL
ncbi:MAG TPA: M14 family zinc carboxypeptidase [Polyangia bacterium]|nr:M14 family zinc carboxypeptidase [Polyangia bacterium]